MTALPPAAPRPLRIVLDTNVLVSGLLSPFRPAARILDLVLAGDVVLLLDDRLGAEYREVCARPKFAFDPDDVARVLSALEALAEHVAPPPLALTLPDADDLPFLEVAAAALADALVTGNARHYRPVAGEHAVSVLAPAELLGRLAERGSPHGAGGGARHGTTSAGDSPTLEWTALERPPRRAASLPRKRHAEDDMRDLPVNLEEVELGMTDDPELGTWYLNVETGETLLVSESDMDDYGDEEEDEDRPAWRQTEDWKTFVRQMREIQDGDTRWEEIPHIETHEAYDRMRRFADTVEDEALADRLYDALSGRGAFSRFRRVLDERALLQPWYDFKDAEERQEAVRWLESLGIRPLPAQVE